MTRQIMVGQVPVGGGAPVSIQSMCTTDTRDVVSTLAQINALSQAGCEIVRLAIPDHNAAMAFGAIAEQSPLPLVADIHFDYRLAVTAAGIGAAKIRINPGNIGSRENVKEVVAACREYNIPIRIGVNGGSCDRVLIEHHGLPQAMVQSALEQLWTLQLLNFDDVCLSLKASNVKDTIAANRIAAEKTACPIHLGVTEAGSSYDGIIKSAMGIGTLLCDGIGDTIRVSLTADPVKEIRAAKSILRAAGIRAFGVEIISCPACGRCRIDLEKLVAEAEAKLSHIKKPLKVAVMGCSVNGPGEAREADCGIAGGDGYGLLFQKGKPAGKVRQEEIIDELAKLAAEI
ncbi:MAG: flavodoxin-dependent (E)-4-hydroxy-3-methylbut-2-enyl-diphosphate synthase [Oscillospiraceae bacterium]|nr:flavodoxin-dependent (E)-4-hydroxy-3-methylbut-2-enyl-diphosphate synthase [Oscillospiraceae bacterium]